MAVLCLALGLAGAPCESASPLPVSAAAPAGKADSTAQQTDWSTAPPDTLIAELRNKLAATKEVLAQVKASAMPSSSVATPEEVIESGLLQQQMVRVYQRQIDSLLKLKSLQQSGAELDRTAANWAGMATPPPYSFSLLDELREKVRFHREYLIALEAMNAALGQESLRRSDTFEKTAKNLRQANEKLESDANAGNARLVWLRDLEGQRNRLAESRVIGIRIEQRTSAEEMAETRQKLAFSERQLDEVKRQISFAPADRKQVRDRLAVERGNLQAEMEAMLPIVEASHQAVDDAADALEQRRASQAAGDTAQRPVAELENELKLCREQAENADINYQTLNWLVDSVKMREKIWELRWPKGDSPSSADAGQGYGVITKLQIESKPIRQFLEQRLKLTTDQILDMERQMLDPSSAPLSDYQQKLHKLFVEREASYRRMFGGLEVTDHLLDLWKQDLDDRQRSKPVANQMRDWWAQVRQAVPQLWQFEIFAVEDTIEVDGQPVTGKRSVTVGKVVIALSILVVGLWVSSKLARFVERNAVARIGIDASSARIARRWVLFLVGAVLLMTSFVIVKIPLTVFAFTGGAVAIGAGFGMQNLLKNLISGLMLLLERPFRPGDLVEVGGVRGHVIDIGMRSSHFRDGNGIETLIPNSTFVEENVTNWTLSSQSVRIVVKLGVAYDAPVQKLTELLLETADRHGLVQDKPPPQVLFEDFGSDALQFGLYVWVEIKRDVDWRTIASDLRYMIHKTLSANGIVMAFPQRDVHLDTAQPLQVSLLRKSAT